MDLRVSLPFLTKTFSSDFSGWRRGLPHLRLKPFKTDLSALIRFPLAHQGMKKRGFTLPGLQI